jgi:hypothetical protein
MQNKNDQQLIQKSSTDYNNVCLLASTVTTRFYRDGFITDLLNTTSNTVGYYFSLVGLIDYKDM